MSRSPAIRRLLTLCALLALAANIACQGVPEEAVEGAPAEPAADPAGRAARLAREILLVDTHLDVPHRLMEEMEDISVATDGDFDYPKARAGGLDAPFMSIYVPASYQEAGGARAYADRLIDLVEGFATRWPGKFAIARSPAEVRAIVDEGRVALPMGMENGAPLEGDPENLRHFFERGIRYITLTHSANNAIADSSYARERRWHGLSPFGREAVAEMNRLGIMVDVSHVSDEAFWQVLEVSRAPVIASHSSCRHFTPGFERNMSDEMIRALAETGGVIQINFGSAFLSAEAQQQGMRYWQALREHMRSNGYEPGSPEMEAFEEAYWSEREKHFADVADVADHIEHVIDLVGIEHVGFGSDFDGVGDSLPTGLKDASQYPNLIRVLLERGYSEVEIEQVASGNLLRVWSEVERVARQLTAAGASTGRP